MRHLRPAIPALLTTFLLACGSAAPRQGGDEGALITAEDLANNPGVPIETLIARKVPGVEAVRTSSGGLALRIRGVSAWDGSERPPLYVVNNLPMQAGREGELPGINPMEIRTIRVLRGAEAAIWGIDGANGVILITLRRGGDRVVPDTIPPGTPAYP